MKHILIILVLVLSIGCVHALTKDKSHIKASVVSDETTQEIIHWTTWIGTEILLFKFLPFP